MLNYKKIWRLAITPQLIAVFALVSPAAHANLTSAQCDISVNPVDSPSCSNLNYLPTQAIILHLPSDPTKPLVYSVPLINSVRTSPGDAATAIDAWYYCRYVNNNNLAKSIFVPFKTSPEWNDFINAVNAPNNTLGISLMLCSRPGAVNVPDNFPKFPNGTTNPFYVGQPSCGLAQAQLVTIPNYAPDKPLSTYTASAIQFACTSPYGPWTETATPTFTAGASVDGLSSTGQPPSVVQPSGGWVLTGVVYAGNPPAQTVYGGGGGLVTHGGGCIAAGSLVLMANGQLKPIEKLHFGDRVRGMHGKTNTVLRLKICGLLKGSTLYGFNGGKGLVTSYHPVVTANGFAAIDRDGLINKFPFFEDDIGPLAKLEKGQALMSLDGLRLVESIQEYPVAEDGYAYDLALSGDQTYFAEGFAVRTQSDTAHTARYLPQMMQDKVCRQRYAAFSAVFLSAGIALSAMDAMAGGQGPATASSE